MDNITKEEAAKIMGCSVRTFEKLYSARLLDVGLGGAKEYHRPEVIGLKDKIIKDKLKKRR